MKPNATLKKRLLVIAGAALALNAAAQGCAFDDTTDAAKQISSDYARF